MTRDEYLEIRNKNGINHIYQYYLENSHRSSHNFTLTIEEFLNFFRFWPDSQIVFENITAYYDHKFEINKIQYINTGQVIKFL